MEITDGEQEALRRQGNVQSSNHSLKTISLKWELLYQPNGPHPPETS